ncbi:MAG: VOC family protein, partial [Pseudomonadota bacterium]
LGATGYDGPLSHEVFNDVFRMSEPSQTARDGRRASHYLASMVPQSRSGVPDAQPLRGCEFIEISCEPRDLDALRGTLSALGMCHVATHRQLAAEGWAGGGVRVVLNTDRAFAEHFLDKHGTSVVAIGLRTENAFDMAQRARRLGLDIVEPDAVDASHRMVALRNVDGTVWYLLDASAAAASWSSAFETVAEPANASPLRAVDHIQLSQSYPDSLSSIFAFRSLFDLRPQPTFDVTDPRGLVQSQVLDSDDASFRIALNTSQAASTTSTLFRHRTGGSGVHHVAFACEDVLAVAESLAEAGVPTLHIPPNYYLDIQARFGLDDHSVDRFRQYNILYDEDAHGHFLQLYTAPIAGAFGFELVQRTGYRGLGAANAHVRTAGAA